MGGGGIAEMRRQSGLERAADCGNTANDVGAIEGGHVPHMSCNMDSFDAYFGVVTTVVCGSGECFVEETKKGIGLRRIGGCTGGQACNRV